MKHKVVVAIPTSGNIRAEISFCLLEWGRMGLLSDYIVDYSKPLSHSRNQLVKKFLSTKGSTHLLFIDSDMAPSANDLLSLLKRDEDIVGGLYYGLDRGEKTPIAWDLFDGELKPCYWPDEVEPVSITGCGFLLIKRSVFNKIPYPWFSGESEDIYFCEKAISHGYEIYVDFSLHVPHYHLTAL